MDEMRWAATITGTKTRRGHTSIRQSQRGTRPLTFPASTVGTDPHIQNLSVSQKVVNVPKELFLTASVARNPGIQPSERTPHIEVNALRKVDHSKRADLNSPSEWQLENQDVTASFGPLDRDLGRRAFRALLVSAWHLDDYSITFLYKSNVVCGCPPVVV